MMDKKQIGTWLRAAMKRAGVTQKSLELEYYGKGGPLSSYSQSAYSLICAGKQDLPAAAMLALSHRLDAPIPDTTGLVSVVGYVGAGAEIHAIDDHMMGAGLEEVEVDFPVRPGAVAVIVRGDSMLPMFEDGDLIGYWGQRYGGDVNDLIGQTCVVKVESGPTYIKKIKKGGSPGLFTLVSANARDIEDVVIEWASPYQFHLPKRSWRSLVR